MVMVLLSRQCITQLVTPTPRYFSREAQANVSQAKYIPRDHNSHSSVYQQQSVSIQSTYRSVAIATASYGIAMVAAVKVTISEAYSSSVTRNTPTSPVSESKMYVDHTHLVRGRNASQLATFPQPFQSYSHTHTHTQF